MKTYLAFKCTRSDLTSIFVEGKLCRQYKIGGDHRFHPKFPTWLVNPNLSKHDWRMDVGAPYSRVLLVRVNENQLVKEAPFIGVNADTITKYPRELVRYIGDMHTNMSAKRIQILEEVNTNNFRSADAAMKFYEEKYGLERAPIEYSR